MKAHTHAKVAAHLSIAKIDEAAAAFATFELFYQDGAQLLLNFNVKPELL